MATPYIGQITIVGFNFAPKGWALCNGQTMPINQNQALFAILGTTFGGNGVTTFLLPNFQGNVPVHVGTGFVLGSTAGEANHTLTIQEMPTHTHIPAATNAVANLPAPTNNYWCNSGGTNGYSPTSNGQLIAQAIGNSGSSQPHNNMQPYLVVNFIVALVGVFPSRN